MADKSNIPTHIVEIVDVDMQMFQLRLAGKGTRAIARALHVAEDKVRETLELMQVPLTAKTKADMLLLELARLDVFQASQYDAAARGDRDAIRCSLEIMKHRADLAGIYAAANMRIDPIMLIEAGAPTVTGTDRIQRAIDAIVGKPQPLIEVEVEDVKPANDVKPADVVEDEAEKETTGD